VNIKNSKQGILLNNPQPLHIENPDVVKNQTICCDTSNCSSKTDGSKKDFYIAVIAVLDNKAKCYINLSECHMALSQFEIANDLIGKALKLMKQYRLSLIYQSGLAYKEKGDHKKP